MASTQSDIDYPANYVHDDVKYLLGWNPKKLKVDTGPASTRNRATMSSAQLPPTSIAGPTNIGTNNRSRMNTGTRPASFYDKHLADKLVLKRVKFLETLVVDLADTVDKAIHDAYHKGFQLPLGQGRLQTQEQMDDITEYAAWGLLREDGVLENYKDLTALFCLPVASTLALHPSSPKWSSLLRWTKEVSTAKFAIADGALKLNPRSLDRDTAAWNFVDNDKMALLEELPTRYPNIAIWEMKSLTVGDEKVMREILRMGLNSQNFVWTICTKGFCEHKEAELMRMVRTLAKAPGVDALSPPWSLSAAGVRSPPGSQRTDDAGTSQPQNQSTQNRRRALWVAVIRRPRARPRENDQNDPRPSPGPMEISYDLHKAAKM
jgi:hypothetical protein